MDLPKHDVLVHYDEGNAELVFYAIDSNATVALRSKFFGGIRPTVAELRALQPDEAMRRVGGTVLGVLDLGAREKIGIATSKPPDSEA